MKSKEINIPQSISDSENEWKRVKNNMSAIQKMNESKWKIIKTYMYVYMRTCIYVWMCMYKHLFMCVCMCINVNVKICIIDVMTRQDIKCAQVCKKQQRTFIYRHWWVCEWHCMYLLNVYASKHRHMQTDIEDNE